MRLIDADLFDKELEEYSDRHYDAEFYTCESIRDMLEDAPTVNPYEWVSIEDRLPENDMDVLIYRGGYIGNLMNVYTYIGDNKWMDEYGYWSCTDNEGITHWMPLPPPPTEKEN